MSVSSNVQNCDGAPDRAIEIADGGGVRQIKACGVDARPADSVVPPYGSALPLDQLQKAVDDCVVPIIAGGVAVGIGPAEVVSRIERIAEIAVSCGQEFHLLPGQRPGRRPVDAAFLAEPLGHPVMAALAL